MKRKNLILDFLLVAQSLLPVLTQKDIDVQKHLIGRCLLIFTIKKLNNTHLTNGSFDFLLRLYIKGVCFKEGLQHKADRI
jgi:hypothetical protein